MKGISLSGIDVVKFGGSSLATLEKIENVAKLVTDHIRGGKKLIVVISGMGNVTNDLLDLTKYKKKNANPEHTDGIISMGERTSARVVSAAIAAHGVIVDFIDVEKPNWPIITNENFGNADILLDETTKKVKELVKNEIAGLDVLIIPGFIGKTKEGKITTIGRGGSDTTAFVIAGALNSKQVIIVSDVEGIMSADPKLVASAQKIERINVSKLMGLADSGVKFLHKKALSYKPESTDIKIISNKSPSLDADGTIINGKIDDIEISIVSDDVSAVTVVGNEISSNPGLIAEMLLTFKENNIGILGMCANHNNLVFYSPCSSIGKVYGKLHEVVTKNSETIAIARRDNLSLLVLNGIGLQETPGSISRAATILRNNNVNIFGQYTVMSEIFLLVKRGDEKKAIELLKKEFKNKNGDVE